MRKLLLKSFLIFFAMCDFAISGETITVPLQIQIGTGFFESNLKSKAKQSTGNILAQNVDNLKFIKTQLSFFTIYHSLYFGMVASFATLGKGTIEQTIDYLDTFDSISSKTSGKSSDVSLQFGYPFYLTPYHLNQTTLMPKFGFGGFWMSVKNKGCPGDLNKSKLNQTWYGPFVGGALEIKTYQGFCTILDYDYFFFSLKNSSYARLLKEEPQPIILNAKNTFHGGYGHNPKLSVFFDLSALVKIGASLNYVYFKEKSSSSSLEISKEEQKASTRSSFQREDLSLLFYLALTF